MAMQIVFSLFFFCESPAEIPILRMFPAGILLISLMLLRAGLSASGTMASIGAAPITRWDSRVRTNGLNFLVLPVRGRSSPKDIVFYHSNAGNGIQFATVSYRAYEAARRTGQYREVPGEWFVTDISEWWQQGFRPTPYTTKGRRAAQACIVRRQSRLENTNRMAALA